MVSQRFKTIAGAVKKWKGRLAPLRPEGGFSSQFFNDIPYPVLHTSAEGKIIDHNNASLPLINDMDLQIGNFVPQNWLKYITKAVNSKHTYKTKLQCGPKFFSFNFVPVKDCHYVNIYAFDTTKRMQAEQQLRQAKDDWENIFDSISDIAMLLSTDQVILDVNRTTVNITGIPKEKIIGKHCYNIFHCSNHPAENCPHQKLIKSKRPESFEVEIEALNKTCMVTVAPVLDSEGKIVKTIHIAKDITERKQAEEELKQAYERFAKVMDAIDALIYVADMQTYKILFVNQYGKEIWGDIKGKICFKALQTGQSKPCDFCKNDKLLDENGQPAGIYTWEFQNTVNGRWFECHDQAIQWPDGRLVRMEVAVDVTERKQAEKELRESAFYLESMSDALLVTDSDVKIIKVNKAASKLWGYTIEELTGKFVLDLFTPEEFSKHQQKMAISIKTETTSEFETVALTKNGSKVPVFLSGKTLKDDHGKTTAYIAVVRNITEQKKAQTEREKLMQELKDKTKEMQKLLSIVSHDMRSPLVNIHGFGMELLSDCRRLDNLLNESQIDDKSKAGILKIVNEFMPESVNYITAGTTKLEKLLTGLSNLSKIGRAEIEIKQLNMNNIIEQIIETISFEAKSADADISYDHLPGCWGDEVQINQAFSNLIGNAIKYIQPGRKGQIYITGQIKNKNTIYCIEDNGVGIPDNHKEKIFQIFHRVDPNSKVYGEGLGLTAVKQIIERHNGKIWLESEIGKGSCFYISLPKA